MQADETMPSEGFITNTKSRTVAESRSSTEYDEKWLEETVAELRPSLGGNVEFETWTHPDYVEKVKAIIQLSPKRWNLEEILHDQTLSEERRLFLLSSLVRQIVADQSLSLA